MPLLAHVVVVYLILNGQTVFRSGCTIFHSLPQQTRDPDSLHLHQQWVVSLFWMHYFVIIFKFQNRFRPREYETVPWKKWRDCPSVFIQFSLLFPSYISRVPLSRLKNQHRHQFILNATLTYLDFTRLSQLSFCWEGFTQGAT